MAQVNAGRVRFVSRGEYNNSTQYYLFDLVDYNGSSYFAKANTTGNVPTNTTYWQLVAEKGNTGGDGPVGPTGNGIASIVKTASAGLIDTYTITFTNGSTTTFNITNGADGDVTQEYVDEENERLKSVFNVLPKVSDSGESIELENTGDTMLYKMDLKGNTSQEVISGEVGLEIEDTSIYVDDVNTTKENYINLKGNTYQETTSISGGDQYDSPSPDYPQEVEVVTGLNEVVVEGKNLFDLDNIQVNGTNRVTYVIDNNNIVMTVVTGGTYRFISKTINNLTIGQQYTIKIGSYNDTSTNKIAQCGVTKSNGSYYDSKTLSDTQILTFTPTETSVMFRAGYLTASCSAGDILTIGNIQLEQGTTATTYEAYKGQTYPINLGSIELCKIGDYQDYIYKDSGKWYKYNAIGKVVLDGSEDWLKYSGQTLTNTIYLSTNAIDGMCKNDIPELLLSNYFKSVRALWDIDSEGTQLTANTRNIRLRVNQNIATDVEQFKTWLSTHNTIVYYVLSTPTSTEITDTTLVNQLNALYNATIYSTAHINTKTSNLLPYIDLKYNVITPAPSPDRASEVEVVTGNNTITISNEDGTKTQTFNVNLGSLEFCKIGNYQDYIYYDKSADKWYKYGAIGKTTNIAGSTNITINDMISDSGMYSLYGGTLSGKTITYDSALLRQNTIYYPLSTPTTTQITDQLLVSQLDELQKAMSYYDKTLITQVNDDKPFILDVIGIRDLQDIFNLISGE